MKIVKNASEFGVYSEIVAEYTGYDIAKLENEPYSYGVAHKVHITVEDSWSDNKYGYHLYRQTMVDYEPQLIAKCNNANRLVMVAESNTDGLTVLGYRTIWEQGIGVVAIERHYNDAIKAMWIVSKGDY